MVSIALCDDNAIQRELMYDYICEYKKNHAEIEVTSFETGYELLSQVKNEGGFDIYILDIVMPDINGLELATTLRLLGDTGKIIFTTASTEYAVASYDVQALYYMMKPVEPAKLFKILDNALTKINVREQSIEVKTQNGDIRLKTGDIMLIEIHDRGLRYHMKDGRICDGLKLRGSFKDAVKPLLDNDRNFVACGVGKLVNLLFVDAIDSESLLFRDGTMCYFPRSAYSELKKAWKELGNR